MPDQGYTALFLAILHITTGSVLILAFVAEVFKFKIACPLFGAPPVIDAAVQLARGGVQNDKMGVVFFLIAKFLISECCFGSADDVLLGYKLLDFFDIQWCFCFWRLPLWWLRESNTSIGPGVQIL